MKTVTSGKKRKRTSKKKRTGLDTHALVAKRAYLSVRGESESQEVDALEFEL